MRRMREWLVRLWGTFVRRRGDRDFEEEIRAHLELAAERRRAAGGIAGRRGARNAH